MPSEPKSPFDVLLTDCLLVGPGDEIVVISDETIAEHWESLLDSIQRSRCVPTFIHLPVRLQRQMAKNGGAAEEAELPYGLTVAMNEVDVIITIINGDIGLSRVRRAIVNRAIGQAKPGKRLAHIPGISQEILDILTLSPIKEIEESCEMFAWALGEARDAQLETLDSSGTVHILTCALNGWYNEPLMSPGVIYPDSWGNIPPGETFCCPFDQGVEGTVVINGSIPGHVCAHREEVVLHFNRGKLVRWETGSARLKEFFDTQSAEGRANDDLHWNTFAELGIGLNPVIKTLTGNSLFDEKAYGTVHIAIGDNVVFGHKVKSRIHADLVIKAPTLWLDGRRIIDRGEIDAEAIQGWRNELSPPPAVTDELSKIEVRRETFGKDNRWPDAFSRRLYSRGRTGYVRIANGPDAAALHQLKQIFEAYHQSGANPLPQALQQSGMEKEVLGRLLGLLAHYQMVYLSPDPQGGEGA